eukprot:g18298.t1
MSSSALKDAATAVLQGKAPAFKDGVTGRSWDDWYAQVRADLASVECWEYVKTLADVIRWRTEVEAELRAEAKDAKEGAARRARGDPDNKQQEQKNELTPGLEREVGLDAPEAILKRVPRECEFCAITATKKCGHCKLVYYCGRWCQAQDWKTHKVFCKLTQTDGLKSTWKAVLENEASAPGRGYGGHASTIAVMRADLAYQRMLRFFHEAPDPEKTGQMPR